MSSLGWNCAHRLAHRLSLGTFRCEYEDTARGDSFLEADARRAQYSKCGIHAAARAEVTAPACLTASESQDGILWMRTEYTGAAEETLRIASSYSYFYIYF